MSNEALVLYEEQMAQIDKALAKLLKSAEAKCTLLVDKDGHLVTRQGFTHSLDTTALAALLAGSFASTREIARLVGEPEFSVLFHQGKRDHIHINIVGERSILVVIFDDRTTIGMVRMYAKEISEELKKIFTGSQKKKPVTSSGVSAEYTAAAESRLEDVFRD